MISVIPAFHSDFPLKQLNPMFEKIKAVSAQPDYMLRVAFENAAIKHYDVKPLSDRWEAFLALRNIEELSTEVKVDAGGYGTCGNNEIELSCNELWQYAKPDTTGI